MAPIPAVGRRHGWQATAGVKEYLPGLAEESPGTMDFRFLTKFPSSPMRGKQTGKAGGEGGIRTLGNLLSYDALAKRCFRPLSHLSGSHSFLPNMGNPVQYH